MTGTATRPYDPATDRFPPSYDCTTGTPWGRADFAARYAPGIISYTTPGHGGFHLSTERNAKVHPAWRQAGGWYEEDCEWATVAVTFPEAFHAEVVAMAHECARQWQPHAYETVTGQKVSPADSLTLRNELFDAAHAADWVATAAWGSWADWVPEGKVGVAATIGGQRTADATTRYFLVDAERYDQRGAHGHVIGDGDTECAGPDDGARTKRAG